MTSKWFNVFGMAIEIMTERFFIQSINVLI